MTNTNLIDALAVDLFDQINNELICRLVDLGLDPGEAWQAVMIDLPLDESSKPDFGITDEAVLNDHDDVLLMPLYHTLH